MRDVILRELAVQSLLATTDLETSLDPRLIDAAAREGITVNELIRERLLLQAGVATTSALTTLLIRAAGATPRSDGFREGHSSVTQSPRRIAA